MYIHVYMKTKLFRNGGSWAVRIPKNWVPHNKEVEISREGGRIIICEASEGLRQLAAKFEEEGPIEFARPKQPPAPEARW